jgi:XTP/dITP diphosphohydrolase
MAGAMTSLLAATANRHKAAEIRAMLGPRFSVTDLSAHPEITPAEETGATFEENAALKAAGASRCFDGIVLADDSGLEVDALGGAPGVFSARYSGAGATDASNRARLLAELAKTGDARRAARFRCVIALARAGEIVVTFDGAVEGRIIGGERGEGGFGYDPLFVPEGFGQTFAELPAAVKNTLSHRGRAMEKLREWFLKSATVL